MTKKGTVSKHYSTCKAVRRLAVYILVGFCLLSSGCATSGDSKRVTLGTASVLYICPPNDTKAVGAIYEVGMMEGQSVRQGRRVLSRSEFEDKIRVILKKNGVDSITLQYKDDGTTKKISSTP